MPDFFAITKIDKLACLEREIKLRQHVYPRLVANGTLTMEEAERQIEIMKAIRDDYAQSQ